MRAKLFILTAIAAAVFSSGCSDSNLMGPSAADDAAFQSDTELSRDSILDLKATPQPIGPPVPDPRIIRNSNSGSVSYPDFVDEPGGDPVHVSRQLELTPIVDPSNPVKPKKAE